MEQYPHLRVTILKKLIENFNDISSSEAYRIALWIFGEYAHSGNIEDSGTEENADSCELLILCYDTIKNFMGKFPYYNVEENVESKAKSESISTGTITTKTVTLKDGTYASITTGGAFLNM
jgi:coatomer subunit beta